MHFVIESLAYYHLFIGFKHHFILSMLAVLAQQLRLYKLPVLDTIKGFYLFRVDCTKTVCDQPPEKFNPNDGDGLCMIFTKSSYELSSHQGTYLMYLALEI
ncbi:hypothetical protein Hanom_Chr03g00193941 [Helianthus anomalus]